jgi:hypothetical protein
MHVELVVPGLVASGARGASLELLVARGRRTRSEPQPLEPWLEEAFGLEGPLAAGALSLVGAGGAPGQAVWARADPEHMQARHHGVLVSPATALSVSREEAEALCEALTRHFAGTLEFRPLDPHRWCARLASGVEPGDPLLTEVQMLLHAHPVNAAREERGAPMLNSVRFWGAGALPAEAHGRWRSVTSDDPLALGLARHSGAAARALPESAARWLSSDEGRHLVILDAANPDLERDWFAPLAAALREERIGMISLHVPDAGLSFETIRGDLRRFWRRPKPLQHHGNGRL